MTPHGFLIPGELVGAVRAVAFSVLGSGTASLGVATIRQDWRAGDDAIDALKATRDLLDAIGWGAPHGGECDVLLDACHRPALELLAGQLAQDATAAGLDQLAGLLEPGKTS